MNTSKHKLTLRQRIKGHRQLLKFNEEIETLTDMANFGEHTEFWQTILQTVVKHRDALKEVLNYSQHETNI